jgi:hypothetical protein
VVLVEIVRVSRPQPRRFGESARGLLEWLADGYATARGQVEARVIVREGDRAMQPVTYAEGYAGALAMTVLRIAGAGVRTYFAGEHGCHVRHGIGGSSEVVRVRILPAGEVQPADHVRALHDARHAFEAALERGDDRMPDNPDAVPPVVRAYHYDPPATDAPVPITVEDFPLAHVLRTHVSSLGTVIPTLMMLRLGAAMEGGTP